MSHSRAYLAIEPHDDKPHNSSKGKGLILETPYKPGFVDDKDLETVKMAVDKELSEISNAFYQSTEQTADTITRVDRLEIDGTNQYGELKASIERVDKVSTEGDKALAESIETLTASVNNEFGEVKGEIKETNRVVAEGDKLLAERIDAITGSFEGDLGGLFAVIEEVRQVSLTGDEAIGKRIDKVEVDFKAADATLTAGIKTEETARVTADQALASRITTVSAEWKNADAELDKKFKGEIDMEKVDRELAQAVLDGKITQEEADRIREDEDILRQLIQEKLDRENGDKEGLEQIKIVKAAVVTESEARANEDEALAKQIETVTAEYKLADKQIGDSLKESVTELKASIRTESLARADADSALASQITLIEAGYKAGDKTMGDKIDKNLVETNAAIKTEAVARADADGALGKRVDTVTANYKAADTVLEGKIGQIGTSSDAAVKQEAIARADADGALGKRIDSVTASYQSADANLSTTFTGKIDKERVDRELAIAVAEGKITQEQADRIKEDDKLLRDLIQEKKDRESGDKVNANEIIKTNAAVTNEATARADADKALASNINTVSAEWKQGDASLMGTFTGEIDKERVARELAIAVAEGKITQEQADRLKEDEKLLRDLIAEQKAREDGDKANLGEINVVKASVVTETNARVSGDSSLANQITSVNSSLNGTIASVQQTLQTNINAVNGKVTNVESKWGISVDAGGNVAGVQLNSSSTAGSEFRVLADKFVFTNGQQSVKPISIDGKYAAFNNVIIREDCVVLGTLYADRIVGLPTGKSFGPSDINMYGNGWHNLASFPIVSAEGRFNTAGLVTINTQSASGVDNGYASFCPAYRVLVNGAQVAFFYTPLPNYDLGRYFSVSGSSGKFNIGSQGGTVTIQHAVVSIQRNGNIVVVDYSSGPEFCRVRGQSGFLYSAIDA